MTPQPDAEADSSTTAEPALTSVWTSAARRLSAVAGAAARWALIVLPRLAPRTSASGAVEAQTDGAGERDGDADHRVADCSARSRRRGRRSTAPSSAAARRASRGAASQRGNVRRPAGGARPCCDQRERRRTACRRPSPARRRSASRSRRRQQMQRGADAEQRQRHAHRGAAPAARRWSVAPTLAPTMTPAACAELIRPALTKLTTITVVAADDCTIRLATAPVANGRAALSPTVPMRRAGGRRPAPAALPTPSSGRTATARGRRSGVSSALMRRVRRSGAQVARQPAQRAAEQARDHAAQQSAEARDARAETAAPGDQRAAVARREDHLAEVIGHRHRAADQRVRHAVRRLVAQHLFLHLDAGAVNSRTQPTPFGGGTPCAPGAPARARPTRPTRRGRCSAPRRARAARKLAAGLRPVARSIVHHAAVGEVN